LVVQAQRFAAEISELVREAVGMPIEWGDMTLEEGVNLPNSATLAAHPNAPGPDTVEP
jgi:hypothetical protein